VVQEEVKAFADCKEKIVCNCTGLGSKELAGDQLMQPVRGHFFMLQPMQEKLDYMLFTKTVEGDRKDFIYFFPKPRFVDKDGKEHACCGMLGGTYLPHNLDDKELQKMDEEEFERLEKRTVSFCCGDKEQ
ncbi:MAG TPA: FAD-dependent oxidoreductase, partial [Candidatus Limnocylindria bacterium]|nr:FAD-dependent oxidoreductase [Candidatus Limnocylindria bacterium]